ncbi:hypothetical protein [Natrinema saccharevitans]|uniref:hypothetical protein n=1 Tax=Natrinema saccharevitans TaxID=301967 RepID=UPI001FE684D7|nr:hypothetical protein [Natrinema saccharevitans]
MSGNSLYSCETPSCDGWKEVITPDGYVCEDCAAELEQQYEAGPEIATDGGVAVPDATTVADELPTPDDPGTIPLPHSFLVTASGPVTRVSERSDATIEKRPVTVSVEYRLETLAEFIDFWKLRDRRRWKSAAVETLLGNEDLETSYELTRSHIEDWDVVADGRVEAFAGLGQLMVDYDGAPDSTDLPRTIVDRLHLAGEDHRGVDEIVIEFARELRRSELWGTGVDLAYINAKHAQHEDVEDDLERVLENLQEGSA